MLMVSVTRRESRRLPICLNTSRSSTIGVAATLRAEIVRPLSSCETGLRISMSEKQWRVGMPLEGEKQREAQSCSGIFLLRRVCVDSFKNAHTQIAFTIGREIRQFLEAAFSQSFSNQNKLER